MAKLKQVERAALLKCRYAGRYDDLADKNRKRATPEEAAEEQWASSQRTPTSTLLKLMDRGLLHMPRVGAMRLTDAGREALRASDERGPK